MKDPTRRSTASYLYNFFTSGLSSRVDSDLLDRIFLFNLNTTLGMVLLALFGTTSFLQGNPLQACLEYAFALVLVGTTAQLRMTGKFKIPSHTAAVCLALLLAYLAATGGTGNTGILWSFTFPLFISFILGHRRGLAASLLYLAFLIIIFSISIPAHYTADFKGRFVGSFICVVALAFIYEYVRSNSHRKTIARSAILEQTLGDLQKTQAALASSEERLRDVLFSSSDWIWEIDADNRFIYASGRVHDVLGYEGEELVGKDFLEIVPPEERIAVQERLHRTVGEKTPLIDFTTANLHHDGSRIWVLMNAVPVLSGFGNSAGLRGITKDISAQKRAQEERASLEDKFRTAQKMEAVGQLAGGIAHDFNNILGAISGYAEMIKTRFGETDEKLRKYAETILTASSRAADLTAKLLAFARRGKFQNVPFNVHHTIDEVADLLSHSVDKRIEVITEHHAGNTMIQGDPLQVQNALMNLAINGCDAMTGNGKLVFDTVNISLDRAFITAHHYEIAPGEYVLISVTDTGTGMDLETKARLFQPFFTTKELGKGTGLGLASVYGTIKSHNGYINVYSEIGHGTTFKIYLPCAFTMGKTEPGSVDEEGPPKRRGGRILLVDDEQFILDISCEMLEVLGYQAVMFRNGNEAVTYYREHHREIDLVIIDMIMPHINGRECFKQMRAINPELRGVLSTGLSLTHESEKIKEDGFIGTIQKPFVMSSLAQAVLKALRA